MGGEKKRGFFNREKGVKLEVREENGEVVLRTRSSTNWAMRSPCLTVDVVNILS